MTAAPRTYVLDTNVLIHDPAALFRFAEHAVYVPMMVLEELDAIKKGASEVARNARQASRFLDAIIGGADAAGIAAGLPLAAHANGGREQQPSGKLFLQTRPLDLPSVPLIAGNTPDNTILETVLRRRHPGVQGHQSPDQSAGARHQRRGLLQRQGPRRHRPALHRGRRGAGGFLVALPG
jgi:predicted ribonuclease YlaK